MAIPNHIADDILSYLSMTFDLNLKVNKISRLLLNIKQVTNSNNEDLTKRHINFISYYYKNGIIPENSYYQQHTDPNRPVDKFIDLFNNMKTNGYDMSSFISVLDFKNILDLLNYDICKSSENRVINTLYKNYPVEYYRINGSHRVACAYVLGVESIPCISYEVINVG